MKYFVAGKQNNAGLCILPAAFRHQKLSSLICACVLVLLCNKANAQGISLTEKNAPLESVLKKIEAQSDYVFIFNTSILSKANPVTLKAKNASLSQVLESCFKNQPLTYLIVKKTIIVKEKEVVSNIQLPQEAVIVYGLVVDEKGKPFAGVRVKVKNTSIFTETDEKGNYKLILPDKNDYVISFEILGYHKQEFKVNDNSNLDVKLSPELKILEEIIVLGYGETNRRDLTGAIGTVSITDLAKAPVRSFDEAFAGRVSGVQVTSPDGQPGASSKILIRGGNSVTQDNSPLYVIDGFPIEDYNINAINPADIEEIEVLKDASSTAIYGARGANGVIIINTKKGFNGKTVFAFGNYAGLQSNTSELNLMNPYEFVKYQFELDSVLTKDLYLTNGKTIESYKGDEGINWQEQLFRTAPMQNYNLSIRGGKKDYRYSISGSAFGQKGTVIASGFQRYQSRVVVDQNLSPKLKVGINGNFSHIKSYGTPFTGGRNAYLNLLINAWQYRPIGGSTSLDELLNDAQDPAVVSATNYQWNPILTAKNELRDRTANQITTNFFAEYNLTSQLKLKVTAGFNWNTQRNDVFNNSKTRLGNPLNPLGVRGVNGSVTFIDKFNFANENILTYTEQLSNKHFFTLLSGFTLQQNTFSSYGSGAIRIPNEDLGVSGISQGIPFAIDSEDSENKLASFLARVNYNYQSKYLFTASFRADGSSKFSGKNKWGYFPSGAFAWNVAQEHFMERLAFLSESKLRISYGVTGNNRITDYAYYSAIRQGNEFSYTPGGIPISGAYVSTLGNPDLKWESTSEIDFGLDLGFLNQRFTFTTDFYRKRTSDLLLEAQLPTSSGYNTTVQNIGSVQNQGVEFTFESLNLKNSKATWSTQLNLAFNRTRLLGLAKNQSELLTTVRWNSGNAYAQNPAYIAQLNNPVALFYGYVWDGVYQINDFNETAPGVFVLKSNIPNNGNPAANILPGDIKYKDINNDNVVDVNDRTIIGNPNPKFIGGLANNFNFKNFDLHVFFQFVYGNDLMNVNRYLMEGGSNIFGANQFASYEKRWTMDNPSNTYFRTRGWGPFVYSSRVIEDGSFLRLKTISIGYKFDNQITKDFKITNFRVFLSAQNLITWTKYSGNDPEVSTYDSALTLGMDYSAYPRSKVITVGLDISF
ncbi:MAG TPA: TonB-dependent receptor [Pelobium sp.]